MKQLMSFKKTIISILFSFCYLGALAQNSTVSFTIQDPTGQAFVNGTLSYVIVPTGSYTFNGSPLNNSYYTPQTIVLDGTGSGSITLPRNDYIFPVGTQWQFNVCPNASSPCTTVNVTINQATQNISSVVNAAIPAIKIPISTVPRAYSDSEVQTTVAVGGIYYNVLIGALRLWNGSAWTTVGSGGGGSGTVTTVSVVTANGFMGTVANASTTPAITLNVDGTHYLPTTTDEANWNAKGTGTVTNVSSSDSSLTITNPTTTPSAIINYAHAGTYTGAQSYSNGAGTPDLIKNYNDPTYGEGTYFYTGSTQLGGILNNSNYDSTNFAIDGIQQWCDIADCSSSNSMILDLKGTGGESPFPSIRFLHSSNIPFVLADSEGLWLGAQFSTYISNSSYLETATTEPSGNTVTITQQMPVVHITGTSTINTITYNPPTIAGYTATNVLHVIADGAWTTTTAGNINTAFTAIVGQSYTFTWDGTKWYVLQPGSGGSGLPCSGTCTANTVGKFGSGGTSVTNSAISDNGTTVTITEPTTISPGGGVGGGHAYTEGTVSAGASGIDNIQAVSSIHRLEQNPNNAGATVITGTSTTAATSGHCVQYASNGYDITDSGAVCGSGGTSGPPLMDIYGRYASVDNWGNAFVASGIGSGKINADCSGSISHGTDSTGFAYWECATSATTGSQNDVYPWEDNFFIPNKSDVFHTNVWLHQTTNEEFWAGFYSGSVGSPIGTALTAPGVAFRYATTASDTTYQCVYYDTSQHVINSTVAVNTTANNFLIWQDESNAWHWAINNTEVCGTGTTISLSSTLLMLPFDQFINRTASALIFDVAYLHASERY